MASQPIANPTIDWSARNLAHEYKTFTEMCKLMFSGPYKSCKELEQFSYMTLWGGSKTLTLWMNSGLTEQTVDNLKQVLKNYCVPDDHQFWANRMEMRHLSQHSGESFQDFSTRVISLADVCQWSNKDEQIVCSLIFGASHREAQRKALSKSKDLSVKDCIEHFVSFEATDNYHKALNINSSAINSVNNNKRNFDDKQNIIKNCYCCGKSHQRRNCPAHGHTCRKCGRSNHYESVCRAKERTSDTSSKQNPKQKQSKKKVHSVEAESSEDDLHFVQGITVKNTQKQQKCFKVNDAHSDHSELVKLRFNTSKLGALATIDTGAEVSVMPVRVYKQLFPNDMDDDMVQNLEPCNMKLTAFNKTDINVIGQKHLVTKHNGLQKNILFVITDLNTSTILGRNDAVNLKCIKFIGDRVRGESNTPSINSTSTTFNIQKAKKKWKNVVPLGSNNNNPHAQILKLFPELFSGVGCLDTMYRIDLKSDAQPVKHAARRVPESIRPKVKEELDRLVKDGIIKRVECPTDWVNSIVCVSKPNGNIRLCLDPKDLNKYIKRPHYYSPTIDDVLPDLCGSKFFSTLDARSGYWNIPLDDQSQLLTTFNTPGYGRYCFKRLPFGLVSSQDLFQRVMDDLLIGLGNAKPVADDIKIHGNSELEHDLYLLEVLDRCQQAGLHLNPDKCQIKKNSVKFYGNLLTTTGMKPDPKKIEGIVKLAPPTNKLEVRSLVGMVTFLNRFIPNTTALLEPIRKLLKNDIHFSWDEEQQQAFQQIKTAITQPSSLAYFDKDKPCEVQCDASLKGIGVCLLQNNNPIYFASKSLTETESRYSNIEREMLGVVFALTRLHQYTFGRHITVISDHKPLESISSKNLNMCPPRLQRMLLRIQGYDYDIQYRPANKIPIPDCLSRLIQNRSDSAISGMNVNVNEVVLTDESKLDIVRKHLSKDETLLTVRDYVIHGWPSNRSNIPTEVLPYWPYKDEIGYYNGILLKCDRVIIPNSLIGEVLKDIHRGHLGIEKCRLRARRSVFWPNMNVDIAKIVNQCELCQVHGGPQTKTYTYNMNESSHYPMHCVGTDLFEYKQKPYLLMIDYFSSYPWVRPLKNISSTSVIEGMQSVFTEFGYPYQIHSDSGSQYSSKEFMTFAKQYDIKHTMSSPYYHESNGKAECYVRIVKNLLKKQRSNINDALLAYRSAPLCNSKHSPAELMFNRQMKDNILTIPIHFKSQDLERINHSQDSKYKDLHSGDRVFIFDTDKKVWEKGMIINKTEQPNQYSILFQSGRISNRNRVHLKMDHTPPIVQQQLPTQSPDCVQNDVQPDVETSTSDEIEHCDNSSEQLPPVATPQQQRTPDVPRRSGRIRRAPRKFEDYE